MTAGARIELDPLPDDPPARRSASRAVRALSGPLDDEDLDPERPDGVDRTDFGSLRLPVPPEGVVDVEPSAGRTIQAVQITLPLGMLSVSALAAPTTDRLWPELAKEINTSLREAGARVRSVQGRWGRELRARTGDAVSVFVGVDGPRWMVYGVATGPAQNARMLDRELRRLLTATVVVRGPSPYPVRTVLPLELPEQMQVERDARAERERIAAEALEALEAQQAQQAQREAAAPAVAERAVAERAVAERAAAERVAAERVAAERVAAERVAAERVAAERVAAERAAAERAAARRAAAEHAHAEARRSLARRSADVPPAAPFPGARERLPVPDRPALPPRSPAAGLPMAVPHPDPAGEPVAAATTHLPALAAPDTPTEQFSALPPATQPRNGTARNGTARNGTAAGRAPFDPGPGDQFGDVGGAWVPQWGRPVDDPDPGSPWAAASASDGMDRAEGLGYADHGPGGAEVVRAEVVRAEVVRAEEVRAEEVRAEEVRYVQEGWAPDRPLRHDGSAGRRAAASSPQEVADGGGPREDLLAGSGTADRSSADGRADGTADALRHEAPQPRTGRRAARRAAELAAELAADGAWSAARSAARSADPPSSFPLVVPFSTATSAAGDMSATSDRPAAGAPPVGRRAARRAAERRAGYADGAGLRPEATVARSSASGEDATEPRESRAAHRRPSAGDAPFGAGEGRNRAAGRADETRDGDVGSLPEPAASRFVTVPRSDGRHRGPFGGANGGLPAEHPTPGRADRRARGESDSPGRADGAHARHAGLGAAVNGTRRADVEHRGFHADTASRGIPDGRTRRADVEHRLFHADTASRGIPDGNNDGNNDGEDAWPAAPPRRAGGPALTYLDGPRDLLAANPSGRHRRPE